MRESAYQWLKLSKFKRMVETVLKVQRAYRRIKFRRIVRRSLMDTAWERFVETQRHSGDGGEEEDNRVARVGEEGDGVVRAARHALHERRREERREPRLRVAVGLVRAMVRARVAVGSCTVSHAAHTCVGTQRHELRI